jgi:hypothetical protein
VLNWRVGLESRGERIRNVVPQCSIAGAAWNRQGLTPTVEIVRQPPTVEILGLTPPVEKRSFEPLQWKLRLTTTNESVRQNTTKRWRQTMTNDEAIKNVREMGHIFAVSLATITGKNIDDKSDLMNGLAAYEILELRGKLDWVDESVDIVLRIIYDLAMERFDKDQIKIGR